MFRVVCVRQFYSKDLFVTNISGIYHVSLLLIVSNFEDILRVVSCRSHELSNNYSSHTCIKEDCFKF